MRKRTLYLPEGYDTHQGWNWTLSRMLVDSRMFNVKVKKDFPYPRVPGTKNGNWSMIQIDDCLIGLDTWDTWSPTSNFAGAGFFQDILKDVAVVLKIQYYDCDYWKSFEAEHTKVRPWIVMPTKDFPLESFQWENKDHKWIGTVTGKNNRFGRQPWTEWCETADDFYSSGEYLVNDTLDSYIERLKECKWGIILKGKQRNHDGKNRRECEFTSCGIPLAMTYKPTYPFPFEAGKHFVYLEKPEDLATLRNIDPEPFARASRQLYYDHFSSYGAAKTLISIVESL